MMIADIAPRVLGMSPGFWIAVAVAVALAAMVWVVMKPLRGWKRFAARHGLTVAGDRMQGTVEGAEVVVELVRDAVPPKTVVIVRRTRKFERDALGRMPEAALEQALREGLAATHDG
ncbi:MAG: hypothetical protein U1F43_25220 [Myxococcota bacterium]